MSTRYRRTALRGAAVGSVAVAAIGLAAAGAWAKSDISFTAGPHTVRPGSSVHLAGQGEDDNSTYNRFCVQERSGKGAWVTVRCSRGAYNGGGSLRFSVHPAHRGLWQFRGVLTEASSPTSGHTWIHQVSPTRTVQVR
ncbi:hypothetical protein [Streptomyces tropicalis]|uniref:Secreted protein n=1 Tax=Streptomyces tropicalis TaxID=3034234 RepID=A0ABT6AFF0_9ACTN|nr:hypothetical protein [Streptomyces tropicalis]MDF3302525.1 hypothetical protein [Streptomyces tropicalis]